VDTSGILNSKWHGMVVRVLLKCSRLMTGRPFSLVNENEVTSMQWFRTYHRCKEGCVTVIINIPIKFPKMLSLDGSVSDF
jgi:hypothetical protein